MAERSTLFEERRLIKQAPRRRGKWWSLSHRSKILAWAFIPASLILGAVALVAFFAYRQITADMVMERDLQLIQVTALQVASDLQDEAVVLEQLSRSLAASDNIDVTVQLPEARSEEALATFNGGVAVVDGEGRIVLSHPPRPALVGQDWSGQSFFRDVRDKRQLVYSNLFSTPSGQAQSSLYSVAVATPILGPNNAFRGAVVGFYRLERPDRGPFAHNLRDLAAPGSRQIVLVDRSGHVLYHPDASQIGANYGAVPSVQRLMAGSDGALRAENAKGEAVVTAYAAVAGSQWGLIAEEAWSSLMAPYATYQNFLLFLLALGLVAPAAIVLVGVRRLMRPLQALTAATQEVARGDFGRTIEVHSGDEIEMLAHHFNLMSAELAASYARLETRLAARTRELRALNAIAAAVSHTGELQAVLGLALDEALDVMDMEAGGIYLLDGAGERLSLAAHRGLDVALASSIGDLGPGQGFSGEVVARGAPVLVPDLQHDPRLLQNAGHDSGFQALGSFPVQASGQVLGALFVVTPEKRRFVAEEVELLTSIGQQIGVAVENARLLQQVKVSAAEEERQRLARELHDAVSQTLFSASLIAEALPRLWEKDRGLAMERLEELRELSRGALAEMRTLLLELRPAVLTTSPLPDLLRQLVEAVRGRSRLQMSLANEGVPPADGLPTEVQIALYRIAQEALNNIVKHAEATRVDVSLAFGPAGVLLEVRDNGRGFAAGSVQDGAHRDSFGLSIMRERAAKIGAELHIESVPGAGTQITVVVPLDRI